MFAPVALTVGLQSVGAFHGWKHYKGADPMHVDVVDVTIVRTSAVMLVVDVATDINQCLVL